ncbi:hypothetical protein SAMN05444921_13434 [Streptomyces wuyuanensis]|uniref:Uncharacterized protein n=1 Tax=Streptomyces wuyuanensis TaxID=1196353 RepID=A0A1H0DJN1_9ACTN|nr:hypothetical protein SAMN05444921_13434 [Streptomyces wuyuanensis]
MTRSMRTSALGALASQADQAQQVLGDGDQSMTVKPKAQ